MGTQRGSGGEADGLQRDFPANTVKTGVAGRMTPPKMPRPNPQTCDGSVTWQEGIKAASQLTLRREIILAHRGGPA